MNKVIYFKMEIDGIESAIKSSGDLKEQLKAIKEQMKTATGEEFVELEKRSLAVRASLRDVEAEQRSVIRALQAAKTGEESYDRLNYSLGELRDAYRKLSKEERDNIEVGGEIMKSIKMLDKELKGIDASMGNFQRNVGNYEKAFDGFTSNIPILGEAKGVMDDLGMATGGVGKAVVVAVALFKGFQEAGKYIGEVVEKVDTLRGKIAMVSDETGVNLDRMTAKSQALAETYGADSEDIVKAVNTVSKAFNIDYLEALRMVEEGYKSGAGSSGEYLDILKEYPTQFKASGASAEEFFAVVAEGAKSGVYSDKMVDTVKEFGLRIREQTEATKGALVGAFGTAFTEELLKGVNSGKVSSIEAMRLVSQEMNDTGLTAKQTQTLIADVFGSAGEDAGLDFILTLKDVKGSMSDLINVNDEYVKKNEERLRLNEEIAAAEVELSNAYKGSSMDLGFMGGEMKKIGTEILTGIAPALNLLVGVFRLLWEIVKVGIEIIEVPFRLIRDGAVYAGEAMGFLDANVRKMNEGFKSGSEEVEKNETKLRGYLVELKKTNVGTEERMAVLDKIKALQPDLLKGYDLEYASINQINKAEGELINTLRNKISMRLKEKELEEMMIQRDKVQKDIKDRESKGEKPKVTVLPNPFGSPIVWTNGIADLKAEEKTLEKNIKTVEDYYENLATTKLKGEVKVKDSEKKVSLGVDMKKDDEAKKAALTLEKKINEELFKAQMMSKESLKSLIEKYNGIERELVKVGLEDTIKLMSDGRDKELKIEEGRYKDSIEGLKKRSADFYNAAKEQGDKIALAFGNSNKEVIKLREKGDVEGSEKRAMIAGKSSSEYIKFMEKAEGQRLAIEKNGNLLIEEEVKIHNKNVEGIEKIWKAERLKKLKEDIDKRYKVFDDGLKREDLLERERVARQVIEQLKSLSGLDKETKSMRVFEFDVKINEEGYKYEKDRIKKELEELNVEFGKLLIGGANDDDLKAQLDKIETLKGALLDLEVERTKNKEDEAEKRADIERAEAEKTLGYVSNVLSMINDISDVVRDRDLKNIDDRKVAEEDRLSDLESRLKTANRREKVEIEKQIKFQKTKLKEVDEERKGIEQEAAERARFVRMAQLISSTALAVMSEFARTGIAGAILAGATGAIQLGIMMAQPFAEGGRVGEREPISGESVGYDYGKFVEIGEMSNGDNVLATLRKGEVVLNEKQQKMLGGNEVFRSLGVKGFSNGGRVGDMEVSGGVAGLYMLERSMNENKDKDFKEMFKGFKEEIVNLAGAINNRIDKLEVYMVTEDLVRELEDREINLREVVLKSGS